MARSTPLVQDGLVRTARSDTPGAPAIAVGSPAWYAWLERTRTFAFAHADGSFTARQEQRRGGQYWYAYRRQQGKLHSTYLGKTGELTPARLEEGARALARASATDPPRASQPAADSPATPPQPLALLATKLIRPPVRRHRSMVPSIAASARLRRRGSRPVAGASRRKRSLSGRMPL